MIRSRIRVIHFTDSRIRQQLLTVQWMGTLSVNNGLIITNSYISVGFSPKIIAHFELLI